jgi:hypothetical protein
LKQRYIHTLDELNALEASVTASAIATLDKIFAHPGGNTGLAALARLKFDSCGCDPLDPSRPLNFVEQLNQSFTYLATIEGVRWLMEHHPMHVPYTLNLGTASGSDIVSADGRVVAETFAATHPSSNGKLRNDIAKVRAVPAAHRYVFYFSSATTQSAAMQDNEVTIVHLSHASLQDRRADV